jgi:hypothetical protein
LLLRFQPDPLMTCGSGSSGIAGTRGSRTMRARGSRDLYRALGKTALVIMGVLVAAECLLAPEFAEGLAQG